MGQAHRRRSSQQQIRRLDGQLFLRRQNGGDDGELVTLRMSHTRKTYEYRTF